MNNLKKLINRYRGRQITAIVLLILLIGVCVLGLIRSAGDGEAVEYTSQCADGDRAFIDVQYASEAFAYFNVNESDQIYFMLDAEENAYIVCMSDDEIGEYAGIQAYTFGQSFLRPDQIRTVGTLVEIDNELMQMAIEEFNYFWGEEVVTLKNCREFFGKYYLDTTARKSVTLSVVFGALIGGVIVFLVIEIRECLKRERVTKITRSVLSDRCEEEKIDAQLKEPRTRRFAKIGVCLTEDYLVSWKRGLKVLRLSELTGIYGVVRERSYELIVRDLAQVETVAVSTLNKVNRQWEDLTALVSVLSEQVPGLEYGKDRIKVEGRFEVTQIDHFFVSKMSEPLLEVQTNLNRPDGSVITPNYLTGLIGAFVGALIGGMLWFVIGLLGLIAGIAGYVILFLSAKGFQKGAGVLTKVGSVSVVIISTVMILAANYFLYAWSFMDAMEGRFTLVEALAKLPAVMQEYELVGDFVKDLLIGYALSLLAGFSTLKKMFGRM